ncbi:MAG: methionyl-tRNA formyltransferase [Bacteroidales bacterium]|nr:methionyl-tRNA formyltransferase [Candidatus Latescibacterota bacterium]
MSGVVFFGSPEFAVPALKALISSEYSPGMVVTQPDRCCGRGMSSKPTPVREVAEANGIEVVCASRFGEGDIINRLESAGADFFVVVAFGLIFPKRVLGIPSKECINVHASLLPAWRGASPVNMAIVNGDTFSGVSTMRMVRKLDAGPVFMQEVLPIDPVEDAGSLSIRLADSGATLLVKTLRAIDDGGSIPVDQPQEGISRAPMLKKEDGLIPWDKNVFEVHDHIRGMNPWPGSFTWHKGRYIKVLSARPCGTVCVCGRPGEIACAGEDGVIVSCGTGTLRIERLQVEGKKPLAAREFLRGYRLEAGEFLVEEK